MIREKELLEKIEGWQNKANRETDPFDKYVSIFIAYNIFYNLYAKKRGKDSHADFMHGDSRRATDTISLVDADQLFKLIESDLRTYISIIPVFREEYWPWRNAPKSVPIAETLKASLRAGDSKKTIEMLLKWLYKVRCNLVHGEKSYKDDQQRRLLGISARLLDMILQHLIPRHKETYR